MEPLPPDKWMCTLQQRLRSPKVTHKNVVQQDKGIKYFCQVNKGSWLNCLQNFRCYGLFLPFAGQQDLAGFYLLFSQQPGEKNSYELRNLEVLNKNMLHLCEQEHRCTSKTFMCVYFYTFHQGKFSNVLRFISRSLKLCHQGISFIHMSAFGLNNIILSRPSEHQIYLLTDHQHQLNLPINMFLFSFRNAWG